MPRRKKTRPSSTPPQGPSAFTPAALQRAFSRAVSLVTLLIGLGVVLWFAGQLVIYRWKHIQEVDSQGYVEIAKAFAHGEWPRWPDEFSRFRNHVWVDPALPSDRVPMTNVVAVSAVPAEPVGSALPTVVSKYSPGWPLCLALGYVFGGGRGALWVNPVLAILGVLAFFLLARELFGNAAAAVCTFVWVTSPMVLMYVDYPLGHGPEITFALLAFLFAARWARSPRAGWAFAAGFCAAFVPLIRPTTVLLWPALAVFYFAVRHEARGARSVSARAASSWREWALTPWRALRGVQPRAWRRSSVARPWIAAAAGALIPLGFLALYNGVLFGHLFRTGYYYTAEQQGFDLNWLSPRLNDWIGSTWHGGTGSTWVAQRWTSVWRERSFVLEDSFLLLALLGLALRSRRPGLAGAFLLWLVPPFLLYVSYYFFVSGPVFYRFILTGVPALVLCIGFLFGPTLRRSAVLQLLVLGAFALWMWNDPPRYFQRRGQVARGEHLVGRLFPYGSFQARDALTGGFAQRARDMPTRDLEPWIARRATAVYAPSMEQWQADLYPNVVAYDIDAWVDPQYTEPFRARRGFLHEVWGHKYHARRVYDEVHALGPDGLQALFRRQVQTHLDADTQVLLMAEEDHPVVGWARATPGWTVEKVYTRPTPLGENPGGLPPLTLWRIRTADAAPPAVAPPSS